LVCASYLRKYRVSVYKIMYALPVYFGYLTRGQRHMLQRVLHTASSRGFTPYYYDLDTLAENAHYHLFRHSYRQAHCLNHLYTVKPRPPGAMQLRTCGHQFELSMNSTNETLLFDRFLIMYDLCVFTCIIFIFVFRCTHVRMSYVLNSYLLTCEFVSEVLQVLMVCVLQWTRSG